MVLHRICRQFSLYSIQKMSRSQFTRVLVAYFYQMTPCFAGGEEAFKACRPAAGLHLFSLVQPNEFKDRFLNTLDGIAYAAPEPASIKWTLVNRICH